MTEFEAGLHHRLRRVAQQTVDQHRLLAGLQREIERALGGDAPAQAHAALERYATALRAHFELEQTIVFPALHGLARALANNAIVGVTQGFSKQMDVVGVGYKADVQGKKIVFSLGYSHPIEFPLPPEVEAKAERLTTKGGIQQYQTTLTLTSIDKQKLGQVAAEMHKLRKPDAYKGKGVRYADVPIKLKPGKTGK